MKKHLTFVFLFLLVSNAIFAFGTTEKQSDESLTIYAYDSFASDWGPGENLAKTFLEETGIQINWVADGDAGETLSRLLREGENTSADIIIGISNDMAKRVFDSNLLLSYKAEALKDVDDFLEFDSEYRLLPFDYGYFSFVYDTESSTPAPTSLQDLTKAEYKGKVILIDPRTSSVGLGLLLWTIDEFGEAGYLDWWKAMKENALTIASGWSSAYGLFTEGEAPLVISYTTSPVYHALWEDSTRFEALVFDEGNALTIESVGILKTSKNIDNSKKFVEYFLTEGQAETAVANSMYPVNNNTVLPEEYIYAPKAVNSLRLDTDYISQNLDKWLEEWTLTMR